VELYFIDHAKVLAYTGFVREHQGLRFQP
jgi:hypothetical protein